MISGRALRDLATLSRLPSEVHLVGSHGSEFDLGFIQRLPPELHELHGRLLGRAEAISREHPGVRLETKPASIAVHVRGVEPEVSEPALEAVRDRAGDVARHPRHERQGRDRAVAPRHRQGRSRRLRCATQASASAVLYLGDDVTDENAFARLHGPDVGVKIGGGETLAGYRVDEPIDAVRVLGFLLETAAALALRRPRGADRAALDALERLDGGAARARTPRSRGCAIRGRTRLRSSPTSSAARGPDTSRSTPSAQGAAARPALPAGHDDASRPAGRA